MGAAWVLPVRHVSFWRSTLLACARTDLARESPWSVAGPVILAATYNKFSCALDFTSTSTYRVLVRQTLHLVAGEPYLCLRLDSRSFPNPLIPSLSREGFRQRD